MRIIILPWLLSGCSVLAVAETGYTTLPTQNLHGGSIAAHAGFGVSENADEGVVVPGFGFSGRARIHDGYATIEPGLHAYALVDYERWSFYVRGTTYMGAGIGKGTASFVFSPTLQPGVLLCPNSRVGWCGSISASVGYDVSPLYPGVMAGIQFGIGWGNVVSDL